MKNILVPIGDSENSSSHLQYAIDFAQAFNARVYAVQVYNVFTKAGTMKNIDPIIERESKRILDELIAKVDLKGVDLLPKTFKGNLGDTLELACEALKIDLMVLEPRTTSVKEEVYLGKTSGRIVKRSKVPALIVPENVEYKPISKIMVAMKSAIIKREGVLNPLKSIKDKFNAVVSLLLVKTPYHKPEDFEVGQELAELISETMESENPTTYQGVLEHLNRVAPDLLVVIRRKRGFFSKLWEKNTVLKKDFYIANFPVLVLPVLK